MRIITISRQFGSGGRELGKRLSDQLGWDYYDKEIIESGSCPGSAESSRLAQCAADLPEQFCAPGL